MVFDATDKILGRLASQVAKEMISARKSGGSRESSSSMRRKP